MHLHLHDEHDAICDFCGEWYDDKATHNQEMHAIYLLTECQLVYTKKIILLNVASGVYPSSFILP